MFKNMFKNIEKTIKIMAKILFFITLVAGAIITVIAFVETEEFLLVLGIGCILAAFFFLPMYGFGVLLEYVKDIKDQQKKL